MEPFKTLQKIARQIEPLNPPVYEFEEIIGKDPFKVLISVLLSSRTKDTTTIEAVKRLFNKADNPAVMNRLSIEEIKQLIYPVGFFRQKAKNIKLIVKEILKSKVIPDKLEELISFPGVGLKTANLVLSIAFNQSTIAVDTHVFRISKRLGLSNRKKAVDVGEDLKILFKKENWNEINKILVGFGQTLCKPRKPECLKCNIIKECNYYNSQA